MTKPLFAPGSRIELDGTNAVISHENENAFFIFTESGERREVAKTILHIAFNEGRLKYRVETEESKLSNPSYLTSSEAQQAQRFLAYLEPLAKRVTPGSFRTRQEVIRCVVKKQGADVLPAPSEITLYKWFKKWDTAGRNILALLPQCKAQQRRSRISPEILELMNETIDELVLTRNAVTPCQAYRAFRRKAEMLGPDSKIPSLQSFYNHVNAVHPLERIKKQHGSAAFQAASRTVLKHYEADRPLERVEIDAVHLTLGLIDTAGTFIANKVIVYLAIDVFSRAIVGYAMKYGMNVGEDAEGVIDCFKSILRQKNADFPYLQSEWFGGKPDIIVGDPGTAIIAESFTELAGYYGVHREVTEASQGWKKPHIERYFRTLRTEFMSRVPGYMPKRTVGYKIDHKLKDQACLSVHEFEKILVTYLVDGYNQSSHSALKGMTPHEKWLQGASKYGEPAMVEDLTFANAFGGHLKTVFLHPEKGIRLHGLQYNSRELNSLYFNLDVKKRKKRKVKIRWSSQDLTKIAVLDEMKRQYVVVPCTTNLPEGMTLAQFKSQNKAKRESIRPDTLNESIELANARARLNEKGKEKRRRRHPETTEVQALSPQDLASYFSPTEDGLTQLTSTSETPSHESPTEDLDEPITTNNPPPSRDFKVRARKS